jgi:hypothetical protein
MVNAGISPMRIARDFQSVPLADLFKPDGPVLDITQLRQEIHETSDRKLQSTLAGQFDPSLTYIGVYGKLGKVKGTFALLRAIRQAKQDGLPVGLLALAHEAPERTEFWDTIKAYDLTDRVYQLPFLPHWRVPEFIRRCASVCCLEQDFPIKFHTPIIAREVLTCGGCLLASSEVIQKLPMAHRLIDGYNCIAVADVNNRNILVSRIHALFEDQELLRNVRLRAREYGVRADHDDAFPQQLNSIFSDLLENGQLSNERNRFREVRQNRILKSSVRKELAEKTRGNNVRFSRVEKAVGAYGVREAINCVDGILESIDVNHNLTDIMQALKFDILAIEKRRRKHNRSGIENRAIPPVFRWDPAAGLFSAAKMEQMIPYPCGGYDFVNVASNLAKREPLISRSTAYRSAMKQGGDALGFSLLIPADESAPIRVIDQIDAALLRACDGSTRVADLVSEQLWKGTSAEACDGPELQKRILDLLRKGLIQLKGGPQRKADGAVSSQA